MSRPVTIRVRRGGARGADESWFEFRIDAEAGLTCLGALETARGIEPGLCYRRSCFHGSCGTCAAVINGVERLACTTKLLDLDAEVITIEPLRGTPLFRDLVLDPGRLFETFPASGYLRVSEVHPEIAPPGGAANWTRFEDCIECGACVSACPVTTDFVGPAALAVAHREIENNPKRLLELTRLAARPDGVPACRRAFRCSRVCPTGVAPGRKIEELRNRLQHLD